MNKTTITGNYDIIDINGVEYSIEAIKRCVTPQPDPNRPGFLHGRQLKMGSRLRGTDFDSSTRTYLVAQTEAGWVQLINVELGGLGNSWTFKKSGHASGNVTDDAMFAGDKHRFAWAD